MPKKILSIDDSRMVHMVVAKTLKPLDIEVITAVNGQEGIEKAEKEKPDLILLDATMPVMDGIEVLAALKANPATMDIPVVMLSADSGKDNVERATQLGALKFISKPFTGDALVAALSAYIDLGQKAA
jgi:CheY-like chemotaxis protein